MSSSDNFQVPGWNTDEKNFRVSISENVFKKKTSGLGLK